MMNIVYISSTTCRLITFVLNIGSTVLFQSEDNKDKNLNRQGSFRKLVPGSSNGDSPLSMSVKMIDRPIVPQTNKQHAVFSQEYSILSE